MNKSSTKCNETVGKWCKNKHVASKIIDTFETYQASICCLSSSTSSILPLGDFCSLTRGATRYLERNLYGHTRSYLQSEWFHLGKAQSFAFCRCHGTCFNTDFHEDGESHGGCDQRLVMEEGNAWLR
jgi:hypothetical protein